MRLFIFTLVSCASSTDLMVGFGSGFKFQVHRLVSGPMHDIFNHYTHIALK